MDFGYLGSYNEIFNESIQKVIARPRNDGNPTEYLPEHSEKTLTIFDEIINKMELKPIIFQLIKDIGFEDENEQNLVWQIIRSVVYLHDIGKINPDFQKKMQNIINKRNEKIVNSEHSIYSALFLQWFFGSKFISSNSPNEKLAKISFLFSKLTLKHHTRLENLKECSLSGDSRLEFFNNIYSLIVGDNGLNGLKFKDKKLFPRWWRKKSDIDHSRFQLELKRDEKHFSNSLFYLYKLLYSLLITSDIYAAATQKNEISISILDINEYAHNFEEYRSKLINESKPINNAREKFRKFSLSRLNSETKPNEGQVFYLYLPTGGGKTLTSLNLALELAKIKNAKRIYYIFPYINIIEQNTAVLKEILGDAVSPIYSNSEWSLNENEINYVNSEKIHLLNQELSNYPIVVMSNVNFFNTFIKSNKSSNYKLFNFTNSIIILDEIQSLNFDNWTLYNNILENFSKYLHSDIIVMSATIPPIDKLSESNNVIRLISPEDEKLQEEFNLFRKRVKFNFEHNFDNSDNLVDFIISKCNDKVQENKKLILKALVVLNSIKDSRDIFEKLKEKSEFDVLLLNSTILPSRRREIIKKLKSTDKSIILVSTQSVEAGMDIDCDIGFREYAPLDNILQVAGRINRNSEKITNSELYIFDYNLFTTKKVYNDGRGRYYLDTVKSSIKKELNESNFDFIYLKCANNLIEKIKNENNLPSFIETQNTHLSHIHNLNFSDLNEIDVIPGKSYSIFINIGELELEKNDSVINILTDLNIPYLYIGEKIKIKSNDILETYNKVPKLESVKMKKLASLISQFMISLQYINPENSRVFQEKGGIFCLNDEYLSLYNYETGLDLPKLKEKIKSQEAIVI